MNLKAILFPGQTVPMWLFRTEVNGIMMATNEGVLVGRHVAVLEDNKNYACFPIHCANVEWNAADYFMRVERENCRPPIAPNDHVSLVGQPPDARIGGVILEGAKIIFAFCSPTPQQDGHQYVRR